MTRLVKLVPFLTLSALAGCPGGSDHDATFAEATPVQLERAFQAASGGDGGSAYIIGMFISQQTSEPGACPSIVTEGSTTTLTGGCTTDGGEVIEGRIVVENVPPFFSEDPDIDPEALQRVTYEDFSIEEGEEDVFVDGVVELDPVAQRVSVALTLRTLGVEVRSDLSLSCDDTDLCTPDGGAEIEIDGLGGAGIEGTWRLDEPAEGSLTLRGADTVTYAIGEMVDECVPYTLADGSTGEVCDSDDAE
jgi:hypothetical protein